MLPNEFLNYAGTKYNELKKKWSSRLKKEGLSFSEDIYNDTIIKVYDILQKHNIEDNNIEGFWYKSFLTNTKRDLDYSYHKRDDDVDVLDYLKDFPVEDRGLLLSDIEDNLKALTPIELNLFLIYYLTDITYNELEELTNIKDVKYKIKKIIEKIKKKKI